MPRVLPIDIGQSPPINVAADEAGSLSRELDDLENGLVRHDLEPVVTAIPPTWTRVDATPPPVTLPPTRTAAASSDSTTYALGAALALFVVGGLVLVYGK